MLKAGWKQFLSKFHHQRPMLASQLGMVEITEVKSNKIILAYPPSGENSKLIVEKTDNLNIITTAINEHFETKVSIKFIIDVTNQTKPLEDELTGTRQKIDEMVAASPRLKNLIEKVDGQVIGIKKVN